MPVPVPTTHSLAEVAVPLGSDESLRVTYLVRAAAGEIATRAETLMLEQTVELPRAAAETVP